MKSQFLTLIVLALCFNACKGTKAPKASTQGEDNSSYTYIPFDPLPVSTVLGNSCDCNGCDKCDKVPFRDLLASFPDQTVRLSIAKIDKSGKVTFGSFASAEAEGQEYRVILDYVNVDVARRQFIFRDYGDEEIIGGEKTKVRKYSIKSIPEDIDINDYKFDHDQQLVSIPVYVGVGLRLTANVTAIEANASLSGLGAIAAEVKAGRLKGSLTVQTLGITGKNISTSLPLPSEINETTIQNALIAIGSIKAQLYDTEKKNTIINPRVVGIYKPIKGDISVINSIIADLAKKPVEWHRPCDKDPLYADYLNEKKPNNRTSNKKN